MWLFRKMKRSKRKLLTRIVLKWQYRVWLVYVKQENKEYKFRIGIPKSAENILETLVPVAQEHNEEPG